MNWSVVLHRCRFGASLFALLALPVFGGRPAAAQAPPADPIRAERPLRIASAAAAQGKYVVVVDVSRNELYLVHRRRVVWSAPVGTGTGLRLESDRDAWDFNTPNGAFHVQYKEEFPTWYAPDWYFVENNLPVPPPDSPKRKFPGGLGAAAVYLGHGIAIHGTNKPELLGERISHGCIRLSNADAQRLFNNVQVGTEVIIVGEPDEPVEKKPLKSQSSWDDAKGPKRSAFYKSIEPLPTPALLERLEEELWMAPPDGPERWPEVAGILLQRSAEDSVALRGLLLAAGIAEGARGDEYGTFLNDLFTRRPLPTLATLAAFDAHARERAARAIVAASMDLFSGGPDAPGAPWPTTRVPRSVVGEDGRGWEALRNAEVAYRDAHGITRETLSRR